MVPRSRHARSVPVLAAVVALLLLVACEPVPDAPQAPPVTPPGQPAAAGTYRAQAEAWVQTRAFPFVLGRTGTGQDWRTWADKAVRTSPTRAIRSLAAVSEAKRRQVAWAFDLALGRPASAADLSSWSAVLGTSWSADRLVAFLFASGEQTSRTPDAASWIQWVYQRLLGRAASQATVDHYAAQVAGGTSRSDVAANVLGALEARRRVVAATYAATVGRAPTAVESDKGVAVRRSTAGDQVRLRSDIALAGAPLPYRVGVVGDSVGFVLVLNAAGQQVPEIVTGGLGPLGGAVIGCGVLAAREGYLMPSDATGTATTWVRPAFGLCPTDVAKSEAALGAEKPQVVIWPIGAWEWTSVKRSDGVVLAGRSSAMRTELAREMVRRIDQWKARGVRRVLLPEWACLSVAAKPILRDPGYVRYIRSVLAEVVRQRPTTATIPATPPQVCVGGDATSGPTQQHQVAREYEHHWGPGSAGAAWGWANWFAPAVADLTGVRP